ncbi:MAG: exodeoxyribonuclease VII small subunit [Desulfobacterales bacterium]|nr:exodeoxyribonuclease VII small subunit [Desulfobacterales bacterium]
MAIQSFETALVKLEKIVEEMESGELPLEKSLKKFEEGVALSRFCTEKLDEYEKKISLLLKDSNGHMKEQRIDAEFDG